jgi:signal transduction histidine kinase
VEKRSEVTVSLEGEPMIGLPARVEFDLYRIAQEALNNVLKHAAASQVTVRVAYDGGRVTLEVKDDGVGFEPDSVGHGGGMGLIGMHERARGLNSQLVVASAPGEGTSVAVTVEVS